ncbi:hypothetical protein D3C87_1914040 [compost metagenome]
MHAQPAGQLHGIAGVQLGEDSGAVGLYRAQGNAQVDGDDFVGPACGHVIDDLAFTGGEGRQDGIQCGIGRRHGRLACNIGLQPVCPDAPPAVSWQF